MALLFGLVILQNAVISGLRVGTARLDVMLLAVLSWSLLRGDREGMVWAFGGGLLLDLACGGTPGRFSIPLLVVAFIVGLSSRYFSSQNLLVPLALSVLLFIPYDLTHMLMLQLTGLPQEWPEGLLRITLPSAFLNAVFSLPVYMALRWLHLKTLGERMEW